MLNETMYGLGSKRSVIREIFEYAKKRSAEIGKENVFDFSIGNPSVPAPQAVTDCLIKTIENTPAVELHGYTSAQGDYAVRKRISDNLFKRFNAQIPPEFLYMTCGAAASLTITLKALACDGDEYIVFAPFFTEYRVFVENAGAKLKIVPANEKTLLPDLKAFERAVTPAVKGIIVNSPNNPSGVVYGEETLNALADILRKKEKEYGHPIYMISDEPYRELVYDEKTKVPFITAHYDDAIVCYSYSKSLSLPGERIGYIAVNPKAADAERVYLAVCGAGRSLGFVCAPALFQKLAAECDGLTADLSVYKKNRDLLFNGLTECGFTCVYPDGAFYLFMKTPEQDASAFCERAKKYELLLVPGDDFGAKGFVRIAYCVQTSLIERALPAFKLLAKEYGL